MTFGMAMWSAFAWRDRARRHWMASSCEAARRIDWRFLLASPDLANAKRSASNTHDSAKKKGVTKTTYQRSSSEETTAERDRRMYRECKGMHNAGACRGYTRK